MAEYSKYGGWPELKESFMTGTVRAAYLLAPMVMDLVESGVPAKIVSLGHRSGAVIMVRTDSAVRTIGDLRGRRIAIPSRFAVDHLRAQRDYWRAFVREEGGKDEIIQIFTKHTMIKDPALYARMSMHGVEPNGLLDEQVLNDMQDYFVRVGNQREKIDLSRVVDRSYVEYALERLGRVGAP